MEDTALDSCVYSNYRQMNIILQKKEEKKRKIYYLKDEKLIKFTGDL